MRVLSIQVDGPSILVAAAIGLAVAVITGGAAPMLTVTARPARPRRRRRRRVEDSRDE
jgi:hypothetical protein